MINSRLIGEYCKYVKRVNKDIKKLDELINIILNNELYKSEGTLKKHCSTRLMKLF